MQTLLLSRLGIAPLGTIEMLIIGIVLLFLAAIVGAIVFVIVSVSKKKKP